MHCCMFYCHYHGWCFRTIYQVIKALGTVIIAIKGYAALDKKVIGAVMEYEFC